MVATRGVRVEQPGMVGTGERLVYTASDGMYVLTGDAKAPPKVVDSGRGSMYTGALLRFHAGDDSVTVTGSVAGADGAGQKVRTETRSK